MRQKRNDDLQIGVAVEGIMLVLGERYKPSKQRAWNSKAPNSTAGHPVSLGQSSAFSWV